MREIKFKYTYSDGRTLFDRVFTLDQIEGGCQFDEISDSPLLKEFKIISRRQFTEIVDKDGEEIYDGDALKDKFGILFGVVKFGKYKLDDFTKHDNQLHHIGWYVESSSGKKQSLEEMCWYINEAYSPIRNNNIRVFK